jgi:hypothetical protein
MDNVIDWLNENELRAYPLQEGSYGEALPENFLLDLILKTKATDADVAKLLKITKTGNSLVVEFSGENNTFELDLTDLDFPKYLRNVNGSLAVFGDGVNTVAAGLTDPSEKILELPIEPSAIFEFDGAWLGVSSLSVLEGFKSETASHTPLLPLEKEVVSANLQLQGEINFVPGFNYAIDFSENVIGMEAGFGLGDPLSCSIEFISPELKDCADIVSFINGVPPEDKGIFRFVTGDNVTVFDGSAVKDQVNDYEASPVINNVNENTVFVGLTFLETDLCSPIQLLPTNN